MMFYLMMVACTENFKKYYSDYSFKLTRGTAELANFAKDDTRAAFIDGYKFTVNGSVTSATKTQTFSKEYTNLKEATAYTLLFDAANVGGTSITISFNNVVDTIELGNYELND